MSFLVPLKNDFLGLGLLLAFWFAMLPDIFENKSRQYKIAYNIIYNIFVYILAVFCCLVEIYKFYQILTDDIFILDELIRNFVITIFHTTALLKCIFLKSRLGAKLMKKILNHEVMVYGSANQKVISIYRELLSTLQKTRNYYFIGLVATASFYVAAPAFKDPYSITEGNITVVINQLPLSVWTPFEKNYWFSYFWSSGVGFYMCMFFVTTDLTINSFIMFGVCQIKILNHFISEFHHYSNEIERKRQCTKDESFRILQNELIRMHQEILNYVRELNGTLKIIMLIEFLPSSIQIAGLIFQMMVNLNVIQCLLGGQFVLIMIARIFIYCNNAHNLAVESESIASEWYNMDWTELPYDVRKNIVFCLVIAQKPLYITLGDMGCISLETFLAILKGTYSYIMLLTTI